MKANARRSVSCASTGLAVLGVALSGAKTLAWAGPYLNTSVEMSIARSPAECGQLAVKALTSLQKQHYLEVSPKDRRVGFTKDSTVSVHCMLVGQNEQRQNQWIYSVAIASTDETEAQKLLDLLRRELKRTVRID